MILWLPIFGSARASSVAVNGPAIEPSPRWPFLLRQDELFLDRLYSGKFRGLLSAPSESVFQPTNAVIVEMAARSPVREKLDGPQAESD